MRSRARRRPLLAPPTGWRQRWVCWVLGRVYAVTVEGGSLVAIGLEAVGTPCWMAPIAAQCTQHTHKRVRVRVRQAECVCACQMGSIQVVELKSVTTASDIWSVGCLAIELLTGLCEERAQLPCVPHVPVPVAGRGGLQAARLWLPAVAAGHGLTAPVATCPHALAPAGSPPYYDLQPLSALYNIVQVCGCTALQCVVCNVSLGFVGRSRASAGQHPAGAAGPPAVLCMLRMVNASPGLTSQARLLRRCQPCVLCCVSCHATCDSVSHPAELWVESCLSPACTARAAFRRTRTRRCRPMCPAGYETSCSSVSKRWVLLPSSCYCCSTRGSPTTGGHLALLVVDKISPYLPCAGPRRPPQRPRAAAALVDHLQPAHAEEQLEPHAGPQGTAGRRRPAGRWVLCVLCITQLCSAGCVRRPAVLGEEAWRALRGWEAGGGPLAGEESRVGAQPAGQRGSLCQHAQLSQIVGLASPHSAPCLCGWQPGEGRAAARCRCCGAHPTASWHPAPNCALENTTAPQHTTALAFANCNPQRATPKFPLWWSASWPVPPTARQAADPPAAQPPARTHSLHWKPRQQPRQGRRRCRPCMAGWQLALRRCMRAAALRPAARRQPPPSAARFLWRQQLAQGHRQRRQRRWSGSSSSSRQRRQGKCL